MDGQQLLPAHSQRHPAGLLADPIYGGNRDMAAWKMIGFPGARYDYRDWVERITSVIRCRRSASADHPERNVADLARATKDAGERCRSSSASDGPARFSPTSWPTAGLERRRRRARAMARHRNRFPRLAIRPTSCAIGCVTIVPAAGTGLADVPQRSQSDRAAGARVGRVHSRQRRRRRGDPLERRNLAISAQRFQSRNRG